MGGLIAKTLRPESLNQVDLPLEFGYCVIVRHAERLDDERLFGSQELEDRKYDYDVDTTLSLEGMEQSVKTGEYLKSFPNIRVFQVHLPGAFKQLRVFAKVAELIQKSQFWKSCQKFID